MVGEFGPCEQCDNCTETQINREYLIEKAYNNKIGYLPWVWKWSDCHAIVDNITGSYGSWVNAPWGESVAVSSPYSIKNTAERPSFLLSATEHIPFETNSITAQPNPFSERVEFSMNLESPSCVEMNIFGPDGKKIASFNKKTDPSGKLVIVWSASPVPIHKCGSIYIYTILIENRKGILFRTGKLIRL